MNKQSLSGIRVLDFTNHISGPFCTKLLADFGADVIKIEKPITGDISRSIGPFPGQQKNLDKSGLFMYLNTNKRGITLDLNDPISKELIVNILETTDILVENFRPGTMEKWGLDYNSIKKIKPEIIYVSITNFGQTGPYKDYKASDAIIYAMGGEMFSRGIIDREPVKLGPNIVLFQGGTAAAVGALGAFFGTINDSSGQHVDISLMETETGTQDRRQATVLAYHYSGIINERQSLGGSATYPSGVYPCLDGYFELSGGPTRIVNIIKMMGNPPELMDPKWKDPLSQSDPALKEEFESYFYPFVMEKTKLELWKLAQDNGVLSAPLNSMEDVANDPYFREKEFFQEYIHPIAGSFIAPGKPWIMHETPWEIKRSSPNLGEHNAEIFSEFR